MLARAEGNLTITEHWLAQLERALSDRDDTLLRTLFHADSHWRDVLALTWRISTVNGGSDTARVWGRIASAPALLASRYRLRTTTSHSGWRGVDRGDL